MSDSDDNAFASADEGEEKTPPKQGQAHVKKETKTGEKTAANIDGDKESKSPSKSETSKGKGRQQQRNKKVKASTSAQATKIMKKQEAQTESEKNEGTSPNRLEKKSISHSKQVEKIDSEEKKVISSSTSAKASIESIPEDNTEKSTGDTPEAMTQAVDSIHSPEEQKIDVSDRDHHTPAQEKVLHKLEESANAGTGGWGWSSWGSSLLSAASNSVQTFTNQVGDGLTTIMDTVESSLGVPDPKALAEDDKNDDKSSKAKKNEEGMSNDKSDSSKESDKDGDNTKGDKLSIKPNVEKCGHEISAQQTTSDSGNSWFASWGVGDLAKKMQDTGKSIAAKGQTLMTEGFDAVEHLAAGGIDVLENIGKKTYNTLAEHDPALRRTRQFLAPRSNKPNLSQTLREARDQAEQQQKQKEAHQEALKAHFGTLFDDYQGIAHLEALEILSNQSEKKVHSLLNSLASEDLAAIKPQLMDIKNAFELDDTDEDTGDQDFTSLVQKHLNELELGTAPDKLNTVHQMVQAWIEDFDSHDSKHAQGTKETHEKSIQALAELTAKGVEQFHKAGEMVLLDKDQDKDCTERAHSFARLTGVLCHEIGNLSNKFAACLNKLAEENKSEVVTSMVTNIYLEASNSSTYIQDAFLLLLPVLQHAALEQAILARTS